MKWSNKNVLITGGAGFIGKTLVLKLIDKNVNVIVLDNFSYSQPSKIIKGVKIINADVSNSKQFNDSLSNEEIDFIIHLAAPSSVILYNNNPIKCFNETTAGIMNVFYYAEKNNIKKVVFPSSGSVYGKLPPPQSESQIPSPVNLYGISKISTEYIASFFAENVKYVGLRIFAGYGPGENHKKDYASPVTIFLNSILNNKRPIVFGNGEQSRDFIYIDDIIKAIIRSVEVPYNGGVINVGTGYSHSFNEIIHMINDLLGKQIRPKYVKKPINYLERTHADINRLKSILNIKPINIYEGLQKYLEHKCASV